MSMFGGAGRTPQNVGETVARYTDYESAQKAVSKLIEAEIPAREISIVWAGLRAVEMVTGRMGYARAAWSGALNGAFLGLMFGAILTLMSPTLSIQVLVGCLLIGVAIGMIMQLTAFALVRRRRDYTSITQPVAEHYEVAVAGAHVASARKALGQGEPVHPVGVPPRQEAPAVAPGPLEPPRYGIRIEDQRPAGEPEPPREAPAPAAPPPADPAPAPDPAPADPAPAADAAVPPVPPADEREEGDRRDDEPPAPPADRA